jgi:hypothetical protein
MQVGVLGFCRLMIFPVETAVMTIMYDQTEETSARQSTALWIPTFAFTVCFAVQTIFSIIGVRIKQDLGSNET